MRALVYTGPRSVDYREVPEPVPRTDEMLVRIGAVGLCGSDMHAYLGHDERRPAPLVLGHEGAGTVVDGPRAGERVTINPLVTCGTCGACRSGRENLCPDREILSMPPRQGAFAEMVAVPERNLVGVPDDVPLEAAALSEPIACGWHALALARRTAMCPPEEADMLVFGGGAIGLGAALAAQALGYRRIAVCEPNDARRERVARAGAFELHDAESVAGMRGRPQLVIDAAGFAKTRETAFALVAPGGTIVHIGLGSADGGVDARRATLQEISFAGAYTYTMAEFRDTAQAIFEGRLGPLDWIDVRALRDGADAFDEAAAGRVAAPKIVFRP